MENPFTLKVGQIFTGFGIGCGIGIGVGRPLNLGAIPMLQQLMNATRGATDAFSGIGMHANSTLRKLGIKSVEAGIGCGVGVGHGFGIGVALKPGVLKRIQISLTQAMVKMMTKYGITPVQTEGTSSIPGSLQSSMQMMNRNSAGNIRSPAGNIREFASSTESFSLDQTGNKSVITPPIFESSAPKVTADLALGSQSEKVIRSFLQNPILSSNDAELGEMAGQLTSENNVLHLLLKHQLIIEELTKENERLRQVLMEDLKVSPGKLQSSNEARTSYRNPCSDCFECRRRLRKSAR